MLIFRAAHIYYHHNPLSQKANDFKMLPSLERLRHKSQCRIPACLVGFIETLKSMATGGSWVKVITLEGTARQMWWRGVTRSTLVSELTAPSLLNVRASLTEGRAASGRRKPAELSPSKYLYCPCVHQPYRAHRVPSENTGCPYCLTEEKLSERKLRKNRANWSKGKWVKAHGMSVPGALLHRGVGCSNVAPSWSILHRCSQIESMLLVLAVVEPWWFWNWIFLKNNNLGEEKTSHLDVTEALHSRELWTLCSQGLTALRGCLTLNWASAQSIKDNVTLRWFCTLMRWGCLPPLLYLKVMLGILKQSCLERKMAKHPSW